MVYRKTFRNGRRKKAGPVTSVRSASGQHSFHATEQGLVATIMGDDSVEAEFFPRTQSKHLPLNSRVRHLIKEPPRRISASGASANSATEGAAEEEERDDADPDNRSESSYIADSNLITVTTYEGGKLEGCISSANEYFTFPTRMGEDDDAVVVKKSQESEKCGIEESGARLTKEANPSVTSGNGEHSHSVAALGTVDGQIQEEEDEITIVTTDFLDLTLNGNKSDVPTTEGYAQEERGAPIGVTSIQGAKAESNAEAHAPVNFEHMNSSPASDGIQPKENLTMVPQSIVPKSNEQLIESQGETSPKFNHGDRVEIAAKKIRAPLPAYPSATNVRSRGGKKAKRLFGWLPKFRSKRGTENLSKANDANKIETENPDMGKTSGISRPNTKAACPPPTPLPSNSNSIQRIQPHVEPASNDKTDSLPPHSSSLDSPEFEQPSSSFMQFISGQSSLFGLEIEAEEENDKAKREGDSLVPEGASSNGDENDIADAGLSTALKADMSGVQTELDVLVAKVDDGDSFSLSPQISTKATSVVSIEKDNEGSAEKFEIGAPVQTELSKEDCPKQTDTTDSRADQPTTGSKYTATQKEMLQSSGQGSKELSDNTAAVQQDPIKKKFAGRLLTGSSVRREKVFSAPVVTSATLRQEPDKSNLKLPGKRLSRPCDKSVSTYSTFMTHQTRTKPKAIESSLSFNSEKSSVVFQEHDCCSTMPMMAHPPIFPIRRRRPFPKPASKSKSPTPTPSKKNLPSDDLEPEVLLTTTMDTNELINRGHCSPMFREISIDSYASRMLNSRQRSACSIDDTEATGYDKDTEQAFTVQKMSDEDTTVSLSHEDGPANDGWCVCVDNVVYEDDYPARYHSQSEEESSYGAGEDMTGKMLALDTDKKAPPLDDLTDASSLISNTRLTSGNATSLLSRGAESRSTRASRNPQIPIKSSLSKSVDRRRQATTASSSTFVDSQDYAETRKHQQSVQKEPADQLYHVLGANNHFTFNGNKRKSKGRRDFVRNNKGSDDLFHVLGAYN